jgi:predicted ATPase
MDLVERDRELSQLDAALSLMLDSAGQAVFVSGEAGTGKTSLVSAFIEEAVERVDDLVIAVGTCDPQTGMVDAYLPFREILQELTGTLESERMAQGAWAENRRRLGRMTGVAGEVLLELGPDLIGLFVPGGSLLAKMGTKTVEKAGLVSALSQQISGEDGGTEPSSGLDKKLIFEQYVNVIRGIADQRALILVVDDLHWADTASIQLLFRLGRRLDGVRLLVIGTFRPNDVAAGRAEERHPLEPVVGELKRYLGDIVVGLDQTNRDDQRQFVDALLDSEPNTFGEEFREAFWERTSGHPLFSVELLAALKQSGGIELNSDYQWTVTDDLDWRTVPDRVEGLIGERVRRL